MLMRRPVPEVLRISNFTGPEILAVKVAVARVVVEEVTVAPTLVQVPPLAEAQSSQVELPSVPYFACFTVTVPAPLAELKFMVNLPRSRIRTDCAPFLASPVRLPTRASSRVQL